jgi:hypothetical protein
MDFPNRLVVPGNDQFDLSTRNQAIVFDARIALAAPGANELGIAADGIYFLSIICLDF